MDLFTQVMDINTENSNIMLIPFNLNSLDNPQENSIKLSADDQKYLLFSLLNPKLSENFTNYFTNYSHQIIPFIKPFPLILNLIV